MPTKVAEFVDHYEVLGCNPDTPLADLKKAYHKKLREFHPDKRQTSLHGLGHQITEKLNDAWAVLSSPEKKEAYDRLWHNHQREQQEVKSRNEEKRNQDMNSGFKHQREAAKSEWKRHDRRPSRQEFSTPEEKTAKAEQFRREGNELYKAAQDFGNSGDEISAAKMYKDAIAKYSIGIELMPEDHKLRSNRALCYGALKDWAHCRDDAYRVTQLNPQFMKGWFMRAKSYWKEGSFLIALEVLESGLKFLPQNDDLLRLKMEIQKAWEGKQYGENKPSRNPSPCHSNAPSSRSRMHTPERNSSAPHPPARRQHRGHPLFRDRPFDNPEDEDPFADIASHFAGKPPPVPRNRPSSGQPSSTPHFDRPPRPSSMPPAFSVPEGMPRPESWRQRSESHSPPLRRRGSLGSMAGARRQVDAAL